MNYNELVKQLSDLMDQEHPDIDAIKDVIIKIWSEILSKSRQYHSVLTIIESSVLQSADINAEVKKIVKEGTCLLVREYLSEEDIELIRSSWIDLGFSPFAFMSALTSKEIEDMSQMDDEGLEDC